MSVDPRRRAVPPIVGARSDPEERDGAPEGLAPCPCGEDAVWYRVTPPESPRAGRALAPLNADESGDNLCDACFPLAVPPERHAGWARLDSAARPRRRTPGEEDQDRRFRGGADAFDPLPDDW